MLQFNSILQLLEAFPDEQSCHKYLEKIIWNDKPTCCHCKSEKHYRYTKRNIFKCIDCTKQYSVKMGTIFENTRLPLKKWFLAIYLNSCHKKGISSHQLAKDINITQKSAWHLLMRIREVYKVSEPERIETVAMVDETYVGGKSKNKHKNKRTPNSRGRNITDKTCVWGIMESGGNVYSVKVPNVKANTLIPLVYEHVEEGATVISDDWQAYGNMEQHYTHLKVNHGAGQYVDYDDPTITTNPIENYWSHFKRTIIGNYHSISRKHMNMYCQEMDFRFNTRHLTEAKRFNDVVKLTNGHNLPYKTLISRVH